MEVHTDDSGFERVLNSSKTNVIPSSVLQDPSKGSKKRIDGDPQVTRLPRTRDDGRDEEVTIPDRRRLGVRSTDGIAPSRRSNE